MARKLTSISRRWLSRIRSRSGRYRESFLIRQAVRAKGAYATGLSQLRRATRSLRSPFVRQKTLILMYHRVMDLHFNPWTFNVTPQHFAEHLEVLQQLGLPIRLQDMERSLSGASRPGRSVVITLDDGYIDVLEHVKPLLERYDVPATVFVPTGNIGREFWWDVLERILLQPGTLPETLRLSIDGRTYGWELGAAARYTEEDTRRYHLWKVWQDDPTPRHFICRSLFFLLLPLPADEQQAVLDALVQWAGAELVARPTHRCLSPEETVALAQGGLIEVGAHTVTHPRLSAQPVATQRDEVNESKARLEEILGAPVRSFAYPYGKRSDFTAETVAVVREAEFTCACSSLPGWVERSTNRFQLPRVGVPDCDGDGFAERLSGWFRTGE